MKGVGLTLHGVTKRFGSVTAVDRLDLEAAPGELLVLVGPSGSGKSTLLRLVAGLEDPTEGSIKIGGTDVASKGPGDRDVAMVFQDYALYPHMTTFQNIAYGLKVRGVPKAEIRRRVAHLADLLGIENELGRRPATLSGGQRQRVAMGRAIIRDPAVFLMDEPLSNLDARLRVHMRAELRELQQRLEVTTLFVTHDQTEAMTMGDRVAVLQEGRVAQLGTPSQLYDFPTNIFVAGFLGSPAMNFLLADVVDGFAIVGLWRLPVAPSVAVPQVIVGLRPEHLSLDQRPDGPGIEGRVVAVEHLGSESLTHVSIGVDSALLPEFDNANSPFETATTRVIVRTARGSEFPRGAAVIVRALPEKATLFDVRTRCRVAPG